MYPLTLPALLAQAEPPPTGYVAIADQAVKITSGAPTVVGLLIAIAVLAAVLFGFAFLLWRAVPSISTAVAAWREERKIDRAHSDGQLVAIRSDALNDANAVRELAKSQQASLVDRLGSAADHHSGQIDKLHDKVDEHGKLLRSVALKVGAPLLLALSAAALCFFLGQRLLAESYTCTPKCKNWQRCCADFTHPNKCCGDRVPAKSNTTVAAQPQSARAFYSLAAHASSLCERQAETCL